MCRQRGLSANLAFSSRSRANLAFSTCSPPCLATCRRLRALMPSVRASGFAAGEHDRRRPPRVVSGKATSPSSCAPNRAVAGAAVTVQEVSDAAQFLRPRVTEQRDREAARVRTMHAVYQEYFCEASCMDCKKLAVACFKCNGCSSTAGRHDRECGL